MGLSCMITWRRFNCRIRNVSCLRIIFFPNKWHEVVILLGSAIYLNILFEIVLTMMSKVVRPFAFLLLQVEFTDRTTGQIVLTERSIYIIF